LKRLGPEKNWCNALIRHPMHIRADGEVVPGHAHRQVPNSQNQYPSFE
jgi:hypothetical protein